MHLNWLQKNSKRKNKGIMKIAEEDVTLSIISYFIDMSTKGEISKEERRY